MRGGSAASSGFRHRKEVNKMESIRVTCLLDRSWDITAKEYIGTQKAGLLLDTASEEEDGKPVPTGIVLLDDGAFASVPLEFIRKETTAN